MCGLFPPLCLRPWHKRPDADLLTVCEYNHFGEPRPKNVPMLQTCRRARWKVERFLFNQKNCLVRNITASQPRTFVRNQQPQSIFTGSSLGKKREDLCKMCSCLSKWRQMKAKQRPTHWRHRNIHVFWNCIILSGGLEFGFWHNTAIERAITGFFLQTVTLTHQEEEEGWLRKMWNRVCSDAGPPRGPLRWSNLLIFHHVGLWLTERFPKQGHPRLYFPHVPPCLHSHSCATVSYTGQQST